MTKVAILPISGEGSVSYLAVSGDRHSLGATAGAALDALTAQLAHDETDALVVVLSRRPDRFFGAVEQHRLAQLMADWRSARDQGQALSEAEQAELEALVETELRAAAARASTLADELGR